MDELISFVNIITLSLILHQNKLQNAFSLYGRVLIFRIAHALKTCYHSLTVYRIFHRVSSSIDDWVSNDQRIAFKSFIHIDLVLLFLIFFESIFFSTFYDHFMIFNFGKKLMLQSIRSCYSLLWINDAHFL